MKKILMILTLLSVFTLSMFAQDTTDTTYEKDESKWTNLSYVNVPVLKIMDSKEGYLVTYQKYNVGVGTVVIPKKWARGSVDEPRKLKFRDVSTANDAYMTIMKEDGQFLRVVLNVPVSRSNYIWGIIDRGVELPGVDKDTLEELDL